MSSALKFALPGIIAVAVCATLGVYLYRYLNSGISKEQQHFTILTILLFAVCCEVASLRRDIRRLEWKRD